MLVELPVWVGSTLSSHLWLLFFCTLRAEIHQYGSNLLCKNTSFQRTENMLTFCHFHPWELQKQAQPVYAQLISSSFAWISVINQRYFFNFFVVSTYVHWLFGLSNAACRYINRRCGKAIRYMTQWWTLGFSLGNPLYIVGHCSPLQHIVMMDNPNQTIVIEFVMQRSWCKFGRHSGRMVCTVGSQREGHGYKSDPILLVWSSHVSPVSALGSIQALRLHSRVQRHACHNCV